MLKGGRFVEKRKQMIRGCLLGLAVGDAMGNTVDARSLYEICRDYGPNGLLGYDLVNGYADVTSYTQIAAFSANGLLMALTAGKMTGHMAPPVKYMMLAVQEWGRSQRYCQPERNRCWLSNVPQMRRRRCMDSRMIEVFDKGLVGTMEEPASRSDHPGALTEVVPMVLLQQQLGYSDAQLLENAARIVAMTHGPESFLCAAVLACAMKILLRNPSCSPQELIQETADTVLLQFGNQYGSTAKVWELLQLARFLAENEEISGTDAMEQLGCRTAAEVLAGVCYACIRSRGDFDAAMILAVNHSGRSAAVGALTGALMGMMLGERALPDFYLECLEVTQYLQELADDMVRGCPMNQGSNLFDDDWDHKYLHAGK